LGTLPGVDYATPGSVPNKAAKYIVQAADASLANAQDLSALAAGLLKQTGGVMGRALPGTDYVAGAGQGTEFDGSGNLNNIFALLETRSKYMLRGRSLAAFPGEAAILWDDFVQTAAVGSPPLWAVGGGGSASSNHQPAGSGGGVLQMTTGATAGSTSQWTSVAGIVSNISTARWYFAARFKVVTTPDAVSTEILGLLNFAANKTIGLGVVGALDSAHFIIQYDGNLTGSKLSLGVSVDTALHVFEMWGTGSAVVNASIDGGTPVQVTQAAAPADALQALLVVKNGTTAAAQTMQTDWVLAMGARI
jgi:hypothetical protein